MKQNMGTVDRLVRVFVAVPMLIALGFGFGTGSVLGVVAFFLAGIMLATAAVGYCPAYIPFGISTLGGISTDAESASAGGPGWSQSTSERRGATAPRG